KVIMDTLLQSKPYRFGAHALIFNKDNYVLLTQDRGYQENEWNFPGGGREANENPAENALREMKEELGLKYDDVEVLGVSSHPIQYDFPQNFIEENLPIVRTYRGQ